MSTILEIEQANASTRTPVVFIHGLWLLPSSWDGWASMFAEAGFSPVKLDWPGDQETPAAARDHPETLAGKSFGEVAAHVEASVRQLRSKPVVIGHSFGGLLAQLVAGRGLARAAVAIDPAPFRGVLPLPFSALKAAFPVLRNPAHRSKAIALTYEQFRYAFANAVPETEARELYETYAVPAPARPLFQAAFANVNPWTEVRVDTSNPDRGPLLIIEGEKDNTVPWAIANAAYTRQRGNPGVTEIVRIPGRGHALVIDGGWREVAEAGLAFVRRFA
jgi:pimeloyl-ACP methyl ester carboxylesterase